jgi:hypothetical protein
MTESVTFAKENRMPIPLLVPIVVGLVAFAVGLGAGKIRFTTVETGVETNPLEYFGESCAAYLNGGVCHEGHLQDLSEDTLTLEVGEQQFLELPLKDIRKLEVYAN